MHICIYIYIYIYIPYSTLKNKLEPKNINITLEINKHS